jgi:ribosomal-protein-alanine N-acetyltransferase
MSIPTIATARLTLRPFTVADAPVVQRCAGDPRVASTTLTIPHPYPDGAAETWIAAHRAEAAAGTGITCAVVVRDEDAVVGAIDIRTEARHRRCELGYWIAPARWGRGYASEAARALVGHAFAELGLARVVATHLTRNPASGAVMRRIGMRFEGILRQHVIKDGRAEDVAIYGVLATEWA